jgi:hypothetical protein
MDNFKLISGNGEVTLIDKADVQYDSPDNYNSYAPQFVSIANAHASQSNSVDLFIDDGLGGGTSKKYFFKGLVIPAGVSYVYEVVINYEISDHSLMIKTEDSDSGNSTAIHVMCSQGSL